MNKLFFGDCLEVLRESVADESVDLIYLDPPFNSKKVYNLLFTGPKGDESDAQIAAFEDTWHWGMQTEKEFQEILDQENTSTSEMICAFRSFLGENDLMAYLVMMTNRCLRLYKCLKREGGLYLHCDSTASHYLKVMLDSVFNTFSFRNEITWKRTSAHNDPNRYGSNLDTILFYTKSRKWTWNQQYIQHSEKYLKRFHHKDIDGRYWTDDNLTAKGLSGGGYQYEYKGCSSLWRVPLETMKKLDSENRLHFTNKGGIRIKRYLDKTKGVPLQTLWDDIPPINSQAAERLGYPTQKPQVLLERIIVSSSNPGDVVLDPFCGCGTAVHAAEKLGRQWIGIDITHLAISLIEKRLNDAFPGIEYEVIGTPKSLAGAIDLAKRDKYQFQWWACSLINAKPYKGKKKGADAGIDGLIYFQDEKGKPKKIIVSVKGGKNVHRDMIADLKNTVDREKAQIGLFVTLTPPTKPMVKEACSAGFYESPHFSHTEFPKIQILTIEGLLNEAEYPRFPDLSMGSWTFKKAQREDLLVAENQKDLFEED